MTRPTAAVTAKAAATKTDGHPGGLMVSQDGYTLALADQQAQPGRDVGVAFTINGPDGQAGDGVRRRAREAAAPDRRTPGLHRLPARAPRAGRGRHVDDGSRPHRRASGGCSPTSRPPAPTPSRSVPTSPSTGDYEPDTPATETRTAEVDGYTVTIDGDLDGGSRCRAHARRCQRDGKPVTDLEPYLGAYGHLVALRAGDLAYLHVHPDGAPGDGTTQPGPEVVFYAAVPSPGDLPPVPGLQAPGRGPHCGVHRQHRRHRDGARDR